MAFEYFSDKEKGVSKRVIEEVPENVWNGIVSIYKKNIKNNHLSCSFPIECPDDMGIYSCDNSALENSIKAEIPSLEIPISDKSSDYEELTNTYDALDFLEFIYKNITDIKKDDYHTFFKHYHLSFYDDGVNKNSFREEVNLLFERNGLVFYLNSQGAIERTLPTTIKVAVEGIRAISKDPRLNELFELAYSKIILPKPASRIEGLEKLWDCFERLKTYYESNKKKSATTLVEYISEGNELFKEHITSEFKELTSIGNKFQIRHFESDKVELTDNNHIDYLFYRMSCLITLCLSKINNG